MDNGFITIHRKIKDWEWYSDSKMVHLFIHLLIYANHREKSWKGTTIKRGQVIIGREELSKTLRISPQSLRTLMTRLKSTNEITSKSTNRFTIITIVKYDDYQTQKEKPTNKSTSKLTNNQQTTNKQSTTTNNDNNVNNDNKTIVETSSTTEISNLLVDNQKHIQIIGLYCKAKDINPENKEIQNSIIKRNLKPASELKKYPPQKIIDTMVWLRENADFKWTLESVLKYIDEDLTNYKGFKVKTDKDILEELLNK